MPQDLTLPADFRRRVTGAFGEAGAQWLEDLPQILDACRSAWSLDIRSSFQLSYNFVAPAVLPDGSEVVLKLYSPDAEAENELAALREFGGDGVCLLLDDAPELQAMLLERVIPGEPLARLAREDDVAATEIAIGLFRRIWREPPQEHNFRTVHDRFQGFGRHRAQFDGGSGPLDRRLFDEGESSFRNLIDNSPAQVLMHGDLHHDNILSATREPWLAIDPKGVVGDPGYDLGAFLYNPIPALLSMPNPAAVVAHRIGQLADGLEMDRARVRGWGMAQAVLSAIWSVEDGDDWSYAMAFADVLSSIPE